MSITQKAMIVKLHVSSWKGQQHDGVVTSKTQTAHGAKHGSGVYNKFLIAKKHVQDIQRAENEARKFHIAMTLPWNDGGDRLLPSKNYLKYSKGMRGLKQKFEVAAGKFAQQYPAMITEAKNLLGSMYNKNDYPAPSYIGDKFAFFTDITPVPSSGDFRVDMEKADRDQIKQELDEKSERSHEQAMADLWERLFNVVKPMAEGMAGSKGKVYDSYVKNIEELTDILPDLNIANDQSLNEMSDEVRDLLTANTPGQLRKDKKLKASTAATAAKMMDKIGIMSGGGGVTK